MKLPSISNQVDHSPFSWAKIKILLRILQNFAISCRTVANSLCTSSAMSMYGKYGAREARPKGAPRASPAMAPSWVPLPATAIASALTSPSTLSSQLPPDRATIEAAALGYSPLQIDRLDQVRPPPTAVPGSSLPFAIPMEYPSYSSRSPRGKVVSVFGSSVQGGFVSILYSIVDNPLELWEKQVRSGTIKRFSDPDIRSKIIEILNGISSMTTFITTPIQTTWTLGIRLPILVLVVKNLRRIFTFDVQILDDTKTRRRFRVRYMTEMATATPTSAALPLRLEDGWNQVAMNLADLTQKIYGTLYVETVRVQIYANARIRRVFFCDKLYGSQEVAADFKNFVVNSSRT